MKLLNNKNTSLFIIGIMFLFSCKKGDDNIVQKNDAIIGKWASVYNSIELNSETLELKNDGTYKLSSDVVEDFFLYPDPNVPHYKSSIEANGKYSATLNELTLFSAVAKIPNISDEYKNFLKERTVKVQSPIFNYYFFKNSSLDKIKINQEVLPSSKTIVAKILKIEKQISLNAMIMELEFTDTGTGKNYIGMFMKYD